MLSDQQKEFFKDSKMRDNDGDLKVYYHKATKDFDIFENVKDPSELWNAETGFNFADNKYSAGINGEDKGCKALSVYLNLKNPLDARVIETSKKYEHGEGLELLNYYLKDCFPKVKNIGREHIHTNKFKDFLFDKGYDSIVLDYEVIAFEPNQIKDINNLHPTNDVNFKNNEPSKKELTPTQQKFMNNMEHKVDNDVAVKKGMDL